MTQPEAITDKILCRIIEAVGVMPSAEPAVREILRSELKLLAEEERAMVAAAYERAASMLGQYAEAVEAGRIGHDLNAPIQTIGILREYEKFIRALASSSERDALETLLREARLDEIERYLKIIAKQYEENIESAVLHAPFREYWIPRIAELSAAPCPNCDSTKRDVRNPVGDDFGHEVPCMNDAWHSAAPAKGENDGK
jgi:hypothetical protein